MDRMYRNCKPIVVCLLMLFMAVSMAACDSFEANAYKSLKSCAVVYKATMDQAYEHYQAMDDATEKAAFWATVKKYADPVQATLVTAKNAAMAYSRANTAYKAALAAAENGTDPGDTADLLAKVDAAKEAATAALKAVDVDSLKTAVKTIISLF